MRCASIRFSGHAIRRMFERSLSAEVIRKVVEQGEAIKDYPDDTPYPSTLLLGFHGEIPIHVVVARNPETDDCYIVTTYVPSEERWKSGFRERKKP